VVAPAQTGTLASRFSKIRKQYPALKRRSEAQVVAWRWATWQMLDQDPYCFERHRWARGRWLEKEPASRPDHHQYRFDSGGLDVLRVRRECHR
jgi:hypothetical protein